MQPHEQAILRWTQESAEEGLFTVDADLRVTSWNRWLEESTGIRSEQVIGQHLFEAFPALDATTVGPFFQRALAGETVFPDDGFRRALVPARSPEGGLGRQTVCLRPFFEDSHVIGVLTTIASPTESALTGTELRREVKAARDAHGDLERQVHQRTAELQQALVCLEDETSQRRLAEAALRHRYDELSALQRLTSALTAQRTVEGAVAVAAEGALEALKPEVVLLFLRDGDRLFLRARAGAEFDLDQRGSSVHEVGQCLCGLCVREGKAVFSVDIHADARCTWTECRQAGMTSFAALPLPGPTEPLGVLGLGASHPRDFSLEAPFLETLANNIASVIQNAELTEKIEKYAAELEQRVRQRTEELQRAKLQAESADRLKSVFLATMSHELRTPLNSVLGFTGLLLEGLSGPLTEEQHKQLSIVQSNGQRLLDLISDVLDISKIEADQVELLCESFDVQVSAERVAGLLSPTANEKGVSLSVECAPTVGEVVSDQRRVEQVLLNLLSNAVKFTDRGGAVTFTVSTPAEAWVRYEVADTGPGIAPEDLERIFVPFQQLEGGLARPHEGTGLGLAICRGLADKLGARLTVDSELGRGSTFRFELPRRPST